MIASTGVSLMSPKGLEEASLEPPKVTECAIGSESLLYPAECLAKQSLLEWHLICVAKRAVNIDGACGGSLIRES